MALGRRQKLLKDKESVQIRQEKEIMRKIQLFCIPYAGGMADSFQELARLP